MQQVEHTEETTELEGLGAAIQGIDRRLEAVVSFRSQGMSYRAIAAVLGVSPSTVKRWIGRITDGKPIVGQVQLLAELVHDAGSIRPTQR